jgi:hypothetical protein
MTKIHLVVPGARNTERPLTGKEQHRTFWKDFYIMIMIYTIMHACQKLELHTQYW